MISIISAMWKNPSIFFDGSNVIQLLEIPLRAVPLLSDAVAWCLALFGWVAISARGQLYFPVLGISFASWRGEGVSSWCILMTLCSGIRAIAPVEKKITRCNVSHYLSIHHRDSAFAVNPTHSC